MMSMTTDASGALMTTDESRALMTQGRLTLVVSLLMTQGRLTLVVIVVHTCRTQTPHILHLWQVKDDAVPPASCLSLQGSQSSLWVYYSGNLF